MAGVQQEQAWGAGAPEADAEEAAAAAGAEADAPAVDATPAEEAAKHYYEGIDIAQGVKCYRPDCEFIGRSWMKLLEHQRNKHGTKRKAFEGTWLLEAAKPELAKRSKALYDKKKQAAGTDAKGEDDDERDTEKHTGKNCNKPKGAADMRSTDNWVQKLVWVKCNEDGSPLMPLTCSLTEPAPATGASGHGALPAPPQLLAVGAGSAAAPPAAPHPSAPTTLDQLPKVGIYEAYINVEPPEPSGGSSDVRRTGDWPIKLAPLVPVGFTEWLKGKHTPENQEEDFVRGVNRFLNMLTWGGRQPAPEDAAKPAFLAAVYINDAQKEVFKLPIMSIQYTWTKKVWLSLKQFSVWHLHLVSVQHLKSLDARTEKTLEKYKSCIELLWQELEGGGLASRITDETGRRLIAKARADRERIGKIATLSEMKSAVRQAMCFLKCLEERTEGKDELAAAEQAGSDNLTTARPIGDLDLAKPALLGAGTDALASSVEPTELADARALARSVGSIALADARDEGPWSGQADGPVEWLDSSSLAGRCHRRHGRHLGHERVFRAQERMGNHAHGACEGPARLRMRLPCLPRA